MSWQIKTHPCTYIELQQTAHALEKSLHLGDLFAARLESCCYRETIADVDAHLHLNNVHHSQQVQYKTFPYVRYKYRHAVFLAIQSHHGDASIERFVQSLQAVDIFNGGEISGLTSSPPSRLSGKPAKFRDACSLVR